MITSISQKILSIALIVLVIVAILCIIGLIFMIKNGTKCKRWVIFASLVTISVAAVSWFTNMGYLRFFMTVCLIPAIHGLIVFFMNVNMAPYIEKHKSITILNILFCVTYLLSYILFPDNNGIDQSFFMFGRIQNNSLAEVAQIAATVSFFCHIALFVSQIVLALVFDYRDNDGD